MRVNGRLSARDPLEVGTPRVGAALDDRPRVRLRRGEPVLEPAGGRDAVVVGEGEQARAGGVPALLAGYGQAAVALAADHAQVESAALELAREHLGGVVGGPVVDDHDLVALAGEGLGPQALEQRAEERGAVQRGDDDRDVGRWGAHRGFASRSVKKTVQSWTAVTSKPAVSVIARSAEGVMPHHQLP